MPAVVISAGVASSSSQNPIPNPVPSGLPPFALNHARILYDSKLVGAGVTVSSGLNGAYTLIPNTAQRWTFTGTGSDLIVYLMPANNSTDTVCINAHNLASVGATIEIFYSLDASGDFVSFAPSQTPTKNNSLMFHIGTAVNARRIQVSITNANGSAFVGSINAGVALQMQRPFFVGHTPAVLAKQADYYSSNTESGNFIGVEVRRRALESQASWANLSDAWYRAYFVPFLDNAEVLPFVFAWNLLEHPTDVVYCKNITNVAPSYSGTLDKLTVDIPLIGIA
jgi:hypothetical protein